MTTTNLTHHEDLLEAFALDALEPDEEQTVIDHLEECLQCSTLVSDYLRTSAALALTVGEADAPERVRTRLLESIEEPQAAPQQAAAPGRRAQRSWSGVYSNIGSRWGRLLMPVTAGAAVVIAALLIAVNVQISGDRDDMMAKNSQLQESLDESRATAAAQLALADSAIYRMQGDLQFLKNTLAQPGNQSLVMTSMQPGDQSHGVLVLSGDMSAVVIMASGLQALEGDFAYHVWLMQRGQRTWAGNMEVDDLGWGTMALNMGDSMSQYDSVQLSRGPLNLASVGIVGDIVLEVALP